MRWKWREATSKWLLASCCDDTEPIIPKHERASCIYLKAYSIAHIETAIRDEVTAF